MRISLNKNLVRVLILDSVSKCERSVPAKQRFSENEDTVVEQRSAELQNGSQCVKESGCSLQGQPGKVVDQLF